MARPMIGVTPKALKHCPVTKDVDVCTGTLFASTGSTRPGIVAHTCCNGPSCSSATADIGTDRDNPRELIGAIAISSSGRVIGQSLQHDGVEHRKHRRVGADAEGQRGDGRERETGRSAEMTQRVVDVLDHAVDDGPHLHLAHAFLDRLNPIELDHRAAARLAGIETGGDLLVDQQIERRRHLVIEVALHAVAMTEVAPQASQAGERHR